ncbi:unnamed protein product, partial [Scytosiphon promiscuus]
NDLLPVTPGASWSIRSSKHPELREQIRSDVVHCRCKSALLTCHLADPAPPSSSCRASLASAPRVGSLWLTKSETSERLPLPLPPKDDTWSPFGAFQQLLASPDVPE